MVWGFKGPQGGSGQTPKNGLNWPKSTFLGVSPEPPWRSPNPLAAFEFTPTLLVNKFSWSYHKVALDLWGSRIWLNVSIFYQFHKAKSRYLSSEPGHWFKKQLSKFSWNQSKDLTFAQIFAFCDLNVIFDNSNWIECVYILKFQIGVNSKAGHKYNQNASKSCSLLFDTNKLA